MSHHRTARRSEHGDYQVRREKMVQGLADAGIKDRRVLAAMRALPRHVFLAEPLWPKAHHDVTLPIGFKQTMTQPYTTALMLEALALRGNEKVLEIGTGSGYQTALLASLCAAVFSVERIAELSREAQGRIRELSIRNASIKHFDGTYGWSEFAPYDGIVVSATAPSVPAPLLEQLATGGRIVIPMSRNGLEQICVVTKTRGSLETVALAPCSFVPLLGRYAYAEGDSEAGHARSGKRS